MIWTEAMVRGGRPIVVTLWSTLVKSPTALSDNLTGSVRVVTTGSVKEVFSSNFESFGSSNGLSQNLKTLPAVFSYYYTHKPFDSTTGLYYYGARFFDPSIDRFVTEDQSGYSTITNPITLNQYVYALNNPETNDDPSGHMIDMWSSGSTNMEPPAAPPAKPPVVTVPPKTPQSGVDSHLGSTFTRNDAASNIAFYGNPPSDNTHYGNTGLVCYDNKLDLLRDNNLFG